MEYYHFDTFKKLKVKRNKAEKKIKRKIRAEKSYLKWK